MDVYGRLWRLYMDDVYGRIWTFMDVYGRLWTFMEAIYGGYIWSIKCEATNIEQQKTTVKRPSRTYDSTFMHFDRLDKLLHRRCQKCICPSYKYRLDPAVLLRQCKAVDSTIPHQLCNR